EVGPAAWLGLTLGSGVLAGIVFLSLTRLRPAAADVGFALLGTVFFGAGAAYAAGSSPVLACAIAASVIVNLAPRRRAIRAHLEAWESAATAALFIIIGTLLTLPTVWILPAAPPLLARTLRAPALTAPRPAAELS